MPQCKNIFGGISMPITKTTRRSSSTRSRKKPAAAVRRERKERLFSLDIGTRSVIGIVAEKEADGLKIVAIERQEHKTRAMLDGQIHDVPQVAEIIKSVKKALEKKIGVPLKSVSVAAAGRALYTMTADAEMEFSGIITSQQERSLEFAGVQAAQGLLAGSDKVDDPTHYYCVGYSTIKYELDGNRLKTLVGQRGRNAKATVIATFLPRQVIDSIQSALEVAKLSMRTITLEPIAAINVLIPPTMRHLNLVLVDIGAGTSDVAITRNGSVIAYGMVPQAGDEITEAISKNFLLDFNVAESVKRSASNGELSEFSDILGMNYNLSPDEIITPVIPNVKALAESIAKQIQTLNGEEPPQAVLLVGGGSLTPLLPKMVAEALGLPEARVAVRHPDKVEGILDIPEELQRPDAVTPLGILKIASINTLHFLKVTVNGNELNLFNFRNLTVSDALLSAGIQLKKLHGHPGLGIMLSINGHNKFIPGSMGTMATLKLNGEPVSLDTPIEDGNQIEVEPGSNGLPPEVTLADILETPPNFVIYVNGELKKIPSRILVNGEEATLTLMMQDGDKITISEPRSVGEALLSAGFDPAGKRVGFTLNGSSSQYTVAPKITVNDVELPISAPVHEGDRIEYSAPTEVKLSDVLNISEMDSHIIIYYKGQEHKVPSAALTLVVNGRTAGPGTIIDEGSEVIYEKSERKATTVSDALVAVGFQPPSSTSRVSFRILVNNQEAVFTSPVKNGDTIDVVIEKLDTPKPVENASSAGTSFGNAGNMPNAADPNSAENPHSGATNAQGYDSIFDAVPGLAEAIAQSKREK